MSIFSYLSTWVTGIMICLFLTSFVSAQNHDWRNADHGIPIYTNGNTDLPCVVVLEDRSWLVVFTTGAGREGSGRITRCAINPLRDGGSTATISGATDPMN